MPNADPPGRLERTLPRFSLALVAGIHALVFAWAARTVPWQEWTTFAIGAVALATLHAATAILAAVRANGLAVVWRATAIASLLFLAWTALTVVTTAFYLATLYDGLGRGVAAAVFFASSGVVLFTLPIGCWGLAQTGRRPGRASLSALAIAGTVVLGLGLWRGAAAASTRPAPEPAPLEDLVARTAALVPRRAVPDARVDAPALRASTPAVCDAPIGAAEGATVVVHSVVVAETDPGESARPGRTDAATDRAGSRAERRRRFDRWLEGRPRSGLVARVDCVQGRGGALDASLRALLERSVPGTPVKLDWIRASAPITTAFEQVAALALRPGLDGACSGARCLMPWQLLLTDEFRALAPLELAPDLRFGISLPRLREALAAESGALDRIEVASLLVDRDGRTLRLERMRPGHREVAPGRFARASSAAERHIETAQRRDGRFRYLQSPRRMRSLSKRTNLPRHAGTTATLCELGSGDGRSRQTARRSLEHLARYERRSPSGSFLTRGRQRDSASIGDSALPLIAFLRCSDWTAGDFDAVAARLAAGLRSLQRADGSFAPGFDLLRKRPLPGLTPLYADGQAILALTLFEARGADLGTPETAVGDLREAVEKAMKHIATRHWNHGLRDFFFIEENWHCLAAQAALDHHRNLDYEQFCLDYMRFRSRFVLSPRDGVASDFVGGLGFGNLLPPQTVPTAGFAEALTAAIAILDARGDDSARERQLLASTLDFLLERQWTETTCFACGRPARIIGGFSESMVSPRLRIDQTQHAWAALGHGARILGLESP